MNQSGNKFDPNLFQARWVLGGLNSEELVDQAVLALQQGFCGMALQQLAGLVKPTRRELGNLPERACAEMGLESIDKSQAVNLLLERGEPSTSDTITKLLDAFPNFNERWKTHIASSGGNPAGSYNDMREFVRYVVEDLYEKGEVDETRRVFQLLEKLLVPEDQETINLIGIGFLESLYLIASRKPCGYKVFEQFTGPGSMQLWNEIQGQWAGKSSLMDVIGAERQRG